MSRRGTWLRGLGLGASSLLLAFTLVAPPDFVPFVQPPGWPKPTYNFHRNPQTPAGFALGRRLFYEPGLSRNNSTSCASCHAPAMAFTHGDHRVSHGVEGRLGTRNSLALVNLAWNTSFHWDGGVNNLETQAVNPLTHPNEMDHSMELVVAKLNTSRYYRGRFAQAFGDSAVTGQRLLKALAQFTVSLESYNSRYDRYMRHEPGSEFTEVELHGLQLFRQHCANCHREPLFTNNEFANNGLVPDTLLNDLGRFRITRQPADSFKFRVPSLRNVEFSAPYMHDGRFRTLPQVLRHYTSGGIHPSRTLAPELRQPVVLPVGEQKALLIFLFALTDKEFMADKRLDYVPD